jgi:hypothetical protein
MRTNQYAFILVAQIMLLCVTFTLEAKMFERLRTDPAGPDSSQVQQGGGDPGHESLLGYLSR